MRLSHAVARSGFTLVELLVVIAIIGVLVALLLPAVQAAREAARRTQCSNNMKQIGLALHNHHDTHGRLPTTHFHDPGGGAPFRWGWIPRTLPFMEQGTVYDKLDFTVHAWQGDNFAYLSKKYPAFLCPSDPFRDEIREEEGFAAPTWSLSQSDYAECIGDYKNSTGVGATPDYGNHNYTTPQVRGMMGRWGWSARFADVTDGLSNTINIGECVGAMCITQNFASQSFGTTAHPINYMNRSLAQDLPTQANPRWDESIGFRSYHPAGANFLLGDGSVRFLSDSLDGVTYRALGSRANGETLTLP
jgi:prepilin-type N-terminal cleavage/methylation domain-containing protein